MPQPRNTQAQNQAPQNPQGTATPPAQDTPANGQASTHDAWADSLLQDGDALTTEKTQLFERIGANRDMLRNLKKSGKLSDDRVARIDKMYPERERKRKKSDDGATPAADQTPAADATPAAA